MHPIVRLKHTLPLLLLALSGTISRAGASPVGPQDTVASSLEEAIPAGIDEEGRETEAIEIDLLHERVHSLETRIELLERRILELSERLERMLAASDDPSSEDGAEEPSESSATTTPAATPAATPDQSPARDPLSSPAAVADALRQQFDAEMMKDPSFVLGLNSSDPRAQKEADRVLQSWVRRQEGRYRKRITWPITIDDGRELPNGEWAFTITVTGPDGAAEGPAFTQRVARRIAQRMAGWRDRADLSRLLMKGMLEPTLEIIPRKPEPGLYNSEVLIENDEVLISEWVRFEFSVRLTTIIPIFVEQRPEPPATNDDRDKEPRTDESR
ncbi:MAG: hypothetical protein VX641_04210 [Planctomycetota bacterium]|nr:hypothetical protein [Planctomycetota bacterium]